MTRCAGCGREMKLSEEDFVWRSHDGRIYGACCLQQAAKDTAAKDTEK